MKQLEFANPQQQEFFEAGPQPTLYLGGFGSGKTYAGILKLLYLADKFPNSRWAIIRKQSNQLKKTTLQTLWQLLPGEAYIRRNDQEATLTLRNESIIYFLHLDAPESLNVLRGLELTGAFVDQVEEISEEAWDLLDSRVGRWSGAKMQGGWPKKWPHRDLAGNPVPPRYLFASANSPGYGSWVFYRWSDESPERKKWAQLGYKTLIASSRDNPYLGEQNLSTMLSKDKDFVARYVDAAWGSAEGAIHSVDPLSILEPTPELLEKIRTSMALYRSLDHGDSSPTACTWFAVDADGNVFAYRQYYEAGKLISEHRKLITALSKGENYKGSYADPSIFFKTAQRFGGKFSVADEYSDSRVLPRETALIFTPGDNNELVTRSRVNEYLRVDPEHIHPVLRTKGSPRLFFIRSAPAYRNGCDKLIFETRAQKRIALSEGSTTIWSDERDDRVIDHAYDTLRYFMATRPPVAHEPSVKPGLNTWAGYAAYSVAARKRRAGTAAGGAYASLY